MIVKKKNLRRKNAITKDYLDNDTEKEYHTK